MDPNSFYRSEADFRKRYKYEPSDLLGEGGFAQVYKAYDRQFEEYVALKFYNKGEHGKYDVLHEMRDGRTFSHKNIIRVHDAFVVRFEHTGGHSYVQIGVLEYANGGNLRDFIATQPSEARFIEVLSGIVKGLEYLHVEKKIIHRDLSPENVLMCIEGDEWIPKIADFGISKRMEVSGAAKDQKKSTQLLGKIDYMAPEQFYPEKFGINGKINTNVDIWAFGVILYELFLHKTPFIPAGDNPMRSIQSITNDPLPDLSDIPDPYRTIIEKCLIKDAKQRVKSPIELIGLFTKNNKNAEKDPAETIPVEDYIPKKQKKKTPKIVWIGPLIAVALIGLFFIVKPLINNGPSNTEVIAELKVFIEEGNLEEARSLIDNSATDVKEDPEVSVIYAKIQFMEYREQGDYKESIEYFNSLADDLSSNPELAAYYQEAKFEEGKSTFYDYVESNQFKEARTFYYSLDKTVKEDQEVAEKFIELRNLIAVDSILIVADRFDRRGDEKNAKAKYNRVLAIDSENKTAKDWLDDHKPDKDKDDQRRVPDPCIKKYSGNTLIFNKVPTSGAMVSKVCITDSEMIITLYISLDDGSEAWLFPPGNENAFFIEYNRRSREIPLKRIKGYNTNSRIVISSTRRVELVFNRLPSGVNVFNLIEGKNQIDDSQNYWNFTGIQIN